MWLPGPTLEPEFPTTASAWIQRAERAFEPFYTTKEVGKGTGLGLATAYAVVQQHQGWIECESQPGVGTTFSVNLPVAEPEAADKAVETDEPALEGGTETILVIDDEARIRKSMDATLSSFGYTMLLGADGVEVLRRHRDEIDLVILDLSMPNMSGYEALPILRSLKPDLKVILVSGFQVDHSRVADVEATIQKPFRLAKLISAIRSSLA